MNQMQHTYIWSEADSSARHQYRNFRYSFSLAETADHAVLHLFADTRYRLSVNGILVDHGPCRFKVGFPKYDTHDIVACLKPGENVIAITVCSYAWGTFLTDASIGGLVVWGEVETAAGSISISTASGWKVSVKTGYRSATGIMSFALGMQEDQDTRLEPEGWATPDFDDSGWANAVPVADQNHWGPLEPRAIPKLSEVADREPHSVVAFDPVPLPEMVYSADFTANVAQNAIISGSDVQYRATAMALNLKAKKPCTIQLATSIGPLFLDGIAVESEEVCENANRAVHAVSLHAGDHILVVGIAPLYGFKTWLIGWPENAPIELAPVPGSTERAVCLPYSQGDVASLCTDLIAREKGFSGLEPVHISRGSRALSIRRGWRTLTWKGADAGFPLRTGSLDSTQQQIWAMDFSREILGRIQIDFEAPIGAVLLFTASERLMPDGSVASGFQSASLQHRIVARGGQQQWQAMHPLGFRYLELLVEAEEGEVTIHDLRVSRFKPYEEKGRFLCSDAGLNQVWQLCRETQVASLEDAYIDCPWRERGLYTGDQIIQYYLNLALFGDHSMMKHCIDLFCQTQDESGLLAPCSHGLKNGRHPDYSALSVESMWHYWACSGDTAFIAGRADQIEKLLQGLEYLRDAETGLVDATDLEPYVDISQIDRRGASLGVNAFICGGFLWGSKLFAVIGMTVASKVWNEKYNLYRDAIHEAFWDSHKKLYLDRRLEDEPETKPSALGNTLALYYGLVDGDEAESCLGFISKCAQNNLVAEHPKTSRDFHFSGYSSYYALAVLYRYGETEVAEQFMRKEWRRMLDGGAWTCWEYFVPSHSLCHAWSASPGWYISAHILGLRYAEPGYPDKLVFDPKPGTIEWAEGAFPHPRGTVRVQWKKGKSGLEGIVHTPPGIEIEIVPQGIELMRDTEKSGELHTLRPARCSGLKPGELVCA